MSEIRFEQITVGPLGTNCYVIWDSATKVGAIIDPGGDKEAIISAVESNDVSVEWILLTHIHPDHTFYSGDLAARYSARIGMNEGDVGFPDLMSIAEMFYDISEYTEFSPTDLLKDGDIIRLGESEVHVLHTPGHSQGGLCFVSSAGVFCGDTLFAGSIGRTDFPGGSYERIISSIQNKLLVLDDSTPLYPGHGPATMIGKERATNPYLQ